MLPGVFDTADVLGLSTRVMVNGVQRGIKSWSVDRELQGDLPRQVAAVSGVMQATGTIVWSPQSDVSGHSPNPWNRLGGWVPSRGDRVEIFVSDGVTEWKRFHGLIDITRGDVGAGFQSTIIDDYDRLSASVNHITMLGIMPPRTIDGTRPWRLPGLNPLYYIDWALRRSRFYATPLRERNSLLDVPMQGSLWPHWGTLEEHSEGTPTGGFNVVAPWGLAKRNFTAWYDPAEHPSMSQPVQMSFMIGPSHSSATDFILEYGSTNHQVKASVDSNRQVVVSKNNTTVLFITLRDDEHIVSVMVKAGQISLRTDQGRERSGTFTASGSGLSQVRVNAGFNAAVAGLQVSRPLNPADEHSSTRTRLTARYDTTSLRLTGNITAAPNIENRTAVDLITEINDAILAAMWIDETGVVQWAQSDTLRRRAPVKTVTTRDDIFTMSWESGLLQTASSIRIEGRRPSIYRSRWRNLTVAEGPRGDTMQAGDEITIFFEPGSDEDWVQPSFDFLEVGGEDGIWGPFNNPSYGTVGLHFERNGEEIVGPVNYRTTIETARLGNQKALIKYRAHNWAPDVEGILSTPPENTILWARHRNVPTTRMKAMGKITWFDDSYTLTNVGGPGPELVHDVGVWSNMDSDEINYWHRVGEWIQSQVTVPQPVIRGVKIQPDPRLQLADVITIDSALVGVRADALITSTSESFDDQGYHQQVGVRVIDAKRSVESYEGFDEWINGSAVTYSNTLQQVAAQNLTYLGLNNTL